MGCMIYKMTGCDCLNVSTSDTEEDSARNSAGQSSSPKPSGSKDKGSSSSKSRSSKPSQSNSRIFPRPTSKISESEKKLSLIEEIPESIRKGTHWRSDSVCEVKELKDGISCALFKVKHRDSNATAILKVAKDCKSEVSCKYTAEDYIWNIVSDHPYIATLLGSYMLEDRLCLVCEFLPGGHLKSIIRNHRSIPTDVARVISAQLTSALLFIHNKDIFHRNVSNKNIFISSSGRAKLSNFDNAVMTRTSRGLHGSFYYQAPEVFEGGTYDITADWFSLGACLYEMISEATPIENHCRRFGINFRHLDFTGKVVVLLTSTVKVPDYFPKDVKSFLGGLLKKNPKKRLGFKDVEDPIKKHPFFAEINWEHVEAGHLVLNLPVTLQV